MVATDAAAETPAPSVPPLAPVPAQAPLVIPGAAPSLNRPYDGADFDQWVRIFERPGREIFEQRFKIVKALGVHPGMRIADIGAGTGLFAVLLARATGPEGIVYAVDVSPDFIAGIEERAREYRVENIVPVLNDQSTTGLDPGSIDLALICDTYHHFENPGAMLDSLHEALAAYGQLVIIDYERRAGFSSPWIMHHVRAGRETVIKEVESAGFRLLDDTPVLSGSFFLRFGRNDPDAGL